MAETKIHPLFIWLLLILCVALTGANVYLLQANRALRASGRSGVPYEMPVGTVVNSISGIDFKDNPIKINTNGKKATVLLIYSPVCRYCEKNWTNWQTLLKDVSDPNVNFVLADTTATATPEFIESKNVEHARWVHRLDPADFVRFDINVTPQTIVIGNDSKVKRVWSGVLKPNDLTEIERLIS